MSGRRAPLRALVFSLAALAAPVAAVGLAPGWAEGEGALLMWLPALLPPFLLAYYRGWQGSSLALAGGMATLALSQAEVLLLGLRPPSAVVLLGVVVLLTVVSLGAGWVAEALLRGREEAERVALTDPLTGLPNRRHASLFLDTAWGTVGRGRSVAVVLFDADLFKLVNDAHGHREGDRVLKAVGDALAARTRRMDLSARFGGDEFISVLSDCTVEDARAFAEAVRAHVAAQAFPWGRTTLSAGVSVAEPEMGAPDVLVAAADRALYSAKAQGRDRVVVAEAGREGTRSPGPSPTAASTPSGLRVLLVDDNADTLRAHGRLLERMGCRVRSAGSPQEALQWLVAGNPVDVLVTDIVMPEMGGFTLADQANKAHPALPVIYVSGYPREEVYWGGVPGVRSAFLQKPLAVEELREAFAAVLGPAPDPGTEEEETAPRKEPDPGASDPGAARPPSLREVTAAPSGRLLIVDDEAGMVRALQRLFVRAGYPEPLGVTDARQVVATLRENDVDLVILDLDLGVTDGFEVLSAIAGEVAGDEFFPVIMLTGSDDPEIRQRALAAGAMDFLGKPFDPAEAEVRVRNLLTTRFLTESLARQRDRLEDAVAERTSELADTRTEILFRLARAAEYRDDTTGRHAERVGLLSAALMSELGMPPRDVDLVRRTAPLHDVGKIGIPDSILLKPHRLTREEFEVMKTHTTIGAQILGGSRHRILEVARIIALHHHERWDGLGYPRGLRGPEIPLEARVVAVADTFDTITHERPYKGPLPPTEALEELRRCRGAQYDPDVVDALDAIGTRVGVAHLQEVAAPLSPGEDTSDTGGRGQG